MTFLSTAFLFALPLVAAPLLLHFFDRRRNTVIEWGAMDFLLEASTQKTSARRLKQWILLLLRVLAVAALILALARPLLPGGYLGSDERGETIFVVDNSMSMHRKSGDLTMIEVARKTIADRVDQMPSRRAVRLMTTAPYPVWIDFTDPRNMAADDIEIETDFGELNATQGQSDLLAALFEAVTTESETAAAVREIVVLTDGQQLDWRLADEAGWKRFRETLANVPIRTEIEVVRLDDTGSNAALGNVAIESLSIGGGIAGAGQPVTIQATIRNYGLESVDESTLRWLVDGEEFATSTVAAFAGEQSVDVNWSQTFATPSTYRISAELDHDDELAEDNTASFVLDVVDQIPIVIVENAFDLAEMQQDAYFVQAALGYVNGEQLEASSIYVPTLVSPDELASIDLSKQRVVVLPNLTDLSDEAVSALEEFVSDGGGLWVALGARTDIDFYNHRLFADASGLAPVRLDKVVDASNTRADSAFNNAAIDDAAIDDGAIDDGAIDDGANDDGDTAEERTRIDPFRSDHPATRHLADDTQLDLADVTIDRRFAFVGSDDVESVSTLLSLNNGQPLAVENYYGRGRVIVQAVPLRMQWSDFARTQSFVVMVRDWIDYLAEPRATQFNLLPGEPIALPLDVDDELADGETSPIALLTSPDGESIEVTAQLRDEVYEFRSSRTRQPGAYSLELGLGDRIVPFHVRRTSAESNLEPLNDEDEARIASATRVERSPEQFETTAPGHSDPLWPYLLFGLIVLMTGELVLSSVLSRERFGSSGVPEFGEIGDGALVSGPLGATVHNNSTSPQMSAAPVSSEER